MFPPAGGGQSHAQIKLADAEQLLELLTDSARQEVERRAKVEWMLARLAPLIGTHLDYHILLLDQLDRHPFPRLLERVTFGPTFNLIEPRDDRHIQELLDLCEPVADQAVTQAVRRLRVPTTYIYSADTSLRWYTKVFKPCLLDPNFWQDCMASYWAASRDRLIIFNAFLPTGGPVFDAKQEQMLSLATRAVAPVMDSDLFTNSTDGTSPALIDDLRHNLSAELRPLLMVVLQGQTSAQIARFTGMMVEEVEIAIRHLCEAVGVRSRGELVARFVDRQVMDWLERDAAN